MITCQFEDGVSVSLRHVTVGVVVENDGKILLVKRSDDSFLEAGKWTIPGGYLDRDETAEEGAVREAREESGYDVELTGLLRINSNPNRPKEDRQSVDLVFSAKIISKAGTNDHEISEVKWFAPDELPEESEFAFDHWENVQMYLKRKK